MLSYVEANIVRRLISQVVCRDTLLASDKQLMEMILELTLPWRKYCLEAKPASLLKKHDLKGVLPLKLSRAQLFRALKQLKQQRYILQHPIEKKTMYVVNVPMLLMKYLVMAEECGMLCNLKKQQDAITTATNDWRQEMDAAGLMERISQATDRKNLFPEKKKNGKKYNPHASAELTWKQLWQHMYETAHSVGYERGPQTYENLVLGSKDKYNMEIVGICKGILKRHGKNSKRHMGLVMANWGALCLRTREKLLMMDKSRLSPLYVDLYDYWHFRDAIDDLVLNHPEVLECIPGQSR